MNEKEVNCGGTLQFMVEGGVGLTLTPVMHRDIGFHQNCCVYLMTVTTTTTWVGGVVQR